MLVKISRREGTVSLLKHGRSTHRPERSLTVQCAMDARSAPSELAWLQRHWSAGAAEPQPAKLSSTSACVPAHADAAGSAFEIRIVGAQGARSHEPKLVCPPRPGFNQVCIFQQRCLTRLTAHEPNEHSSSLEPGLRSRARAEGESVSKSEPVRRVRVDVVGSSRSALGPVEAEMRARPVRVESQWAKGDEFAASA